VWGAYTALKDIIDLEVVFWGNAQGSGSKIQCQHGPPECRVQMVYACSKNLYPGVDNYLPFVHCVDTTLVKDFPKGLPEGAVNMTTANNIITSCAKTVGHDLTKLNACASGPDGIKYINEEAKKTPGHTGVPFWTVNGGNVTYPPPEDLIKAVCAAYTGTKPAACSKADDDMAPQGVADSYESYSCDSQVHPRLSARAVIV